MDINLLIILLLGALSVLVVIWGYQHDKPKPSPDDDALLITDEHCNPVPTMAVIKKAQELAYCQTVWTNYQQMEARDCLERLATECLCNEVQKA